MKKKLRGRWTRTLALRAGCSSLAIIALAQTAEAACTPNPTQANITTVCSGVTSQGLSATTSGTSIQVLTGAQLQSGSADAGLVSTGSYGLQVDGTIAGGAKPGVIVTNGIPFVVTYDNYDPYAGAAPNFAPIGSTIYPSGSLQIAIGAAGAITGSTAVSLQTRPDNSIGTISASIDNAGLLSGSAGPALVAGPKGLFSGIYNRASGVINGISGAVTSLGNAGLIDGGSASAIAIPGGNGYGFIQNSGSILSNSSSATVLSGPNTISNSGMIANSGNGPAIATAQFLSVSNDASGSISSAGNVAIQTTDVLQLTNRGNIVGSVITGAPTGGFLSGSRIDTVGGTIQGDLLLGGGNDLLFGTLDAAGHVAEVSGIVDGGGGIDTFSVIVAKDTTLASATLPTNFERLDLNLTSNASVTLAAGFAAPFGMSVGGSGTLTVAGDIRSSGSAFSSSSNTFGYGFSLANQGNITSTLSDISQSAIALSYYSSINNSGTITAIGGGGVDVSGQSAVNSGSILADGTALKIFSASGSNSGTITSNQGIGLAFSGSQNQFTNSGTISGNAAGASVSNVTLINTGTISSPGLGVDLQSYGTLDNRAGGIVSGGVGTLQTGGFVLNARVVNAGTINGNVSLGTATLPYNYGSSNIFIAASGGVVNGNLVLGTGNDLFVTSLINDGPGQFAGVTGTVTGGGSETIRYLANQDSTANLTTAGIFTNIGYELSGNAKLTLSAASAQVLSVDFAGSGTVDLTADLSQTGDRSILNLNASPALPTTSFMPNALDVTSRGALTRIHSQLYDYAAPAIALSTGSTFTNAGTISIKDMAPSPYGGNLLAAIAGTGTVINSGSITIDGGTAVFNTGFSGSLVFTNSGSIVQASGGMDGQGVTGATSLTNTGSIVTGGSAVIAGTPYGASSQVVNSGLIQSLHGAAIVGASSTYGSTKVTNQGGGVITGGVGQPAILLSPGAVIDNAGTINGDVNLNVSPFYYYTSTASSTYISNGGTLNGNLTFGAGDDIFVAFNDGATGVTGTIDAGAGTDTFGLAYTSSTSVTAGGALPASFERQAFGAVGSDTIVTVAGPAGGLSSGLRFFGDGTVINNANIYSLDPFHPSNADVILGGFDSQKFSSSLSFVNTGTISDVVGNAASFINNGIIAGYNFGGYYVSLSPVSGQDFNFLNSGAIINATAYLSNYHFNTPSISIIGHGSDKPSGSVSIKNDGVIGGYISTNITAMDLKFDNSGYIGDIGVNGPNFVMGQAVDIFDGSNVYFRSDDLTIIPPNGHSATLTNSGTIQGSLSATIVASDLMVSNSGKIDAGSPQGQAVSIVLAPYLIYDVPQSAVIWTDQHSAIFSNSGTIAGAVSVNADAAALTVDNTGSIAVPVTPAGQFYPSPLTALTLTAASGTNVAVNISNSGSITDLAYGGSAIAIGATATADAELVPAATPVAGGVTATMRIVNSGTVRADGGALVGTVFGSTTLSPAAALAAAAFADGGSTIDITNGATGILSAAGAPASFAFGFGGAPAPISTGGSVAIVAFADTVIVHNDGIITGGMGTTLPTNTYVNLASQNFDGSGQFLAGAIQTYNSADTIINSKTGSITGSIDLGARDDLIENYGKITGNVYLRDGDDTFVQSIGATLDGVADGGAGTNSLVIDITGGGRLDHTLLDKFVNFDAPELIGSGTLTVSGPIPVDSLRLNEATLSISAGETLQTLGPVTLRGTGDNHLINQGTIMGSIDLGNGNNTIDTSGRIDGSITFGAGADVLTLRHGASFGGPVDAGAGANTIILAEGGTSVTPEELDLSSFAGFDHLRQDSGTVALSGTFATDILDVTAGRLIGRTGSTITAQTITVANGATFGSAGRVNGNIMVSGTLSPGASPGTMTVAGNVALGGGSASLFELTPAVSDLLLISGSLAIAPGATLIFSGTRPLPAGSAFDLIVAGGGITGSFTRIAKPASVVGFVAQRGNHIQLFGPFAVDPAFNPQVAATIGGVDGTLVTGQASTALLARLPGLLTAGGTANPTAFAQLNPEAYASASQIGTENGLAIAAVLRSENVRSPLTDHGLFSFVQGLGAWRKLAGDTAIGTSRGNVATSGTMGGIGFGSRDISASVFVGHLDGHQTIPGLAARTSADGNLIGLNGHMTMGGVDASIMIAYDGSSADTRRALPGGGTATSHYGLHSLLGDMSVSITRPIGKQLSVTPQLGLTHVDTLRGASQEAGDGDFGLDIQAQHYRTTFIDGSIRIDRAVGRWQPWLSAGVRRLLGSTDRTASAAFLGTTSTFTVAGVGRQRTLATGGTGFSWKANDNLTFSGAYQGEFGHDGSGHHLSLGLRMGF